jgi:hypothetical protein
MDMLAITLLRSRYLEAVSAAETYRDAAEEAFDLRAFYQALATTYERSAREMRLMLDAAERLSALATEAA